MKKTLETVWDWYETENAMVRSEEKEEIVKTLLPTEQALRAELTEEQRERLDQIKDCLYQMQGISEKEAFVHGVRFATAYLLDALYGT